MNFIYGCVQFSLPLVAAKWIYDWLTAQTPNYGGGHQTIAMLAFCVIFVLWSLLLSKTEDWYKRTNLTVKLQHAAILGSFAAFGTFMIEVYKVMIA